MSSIEACFFDLDKTTIDEHGRLYDGLAAALHPDERQFAATALTARGFTRYQEAITGNPVLAATPGVPVALEAGGRIVSSDLSQNLVYSPLSKAEQEGLFGYIADNAPLRYVAFHERELRTKTHLWVPDSVEADRLREAFSANADVVSSGLEELFASIEEAEPCLVTCRSYGEPLPALPTGMHGYNRGSTINFLNNGVNKGMAALVIADLAGLRLDQILVAGNDESDIPMLGLDGLGCAVVVGHELTPETAGLSPNTVFLDEPSELGAFVLQKVGA